MSQGTSAGISINMVSVHPPLENKVAPEAEKKPKDDGIKVPVSLTLLCKRIEDDEEHEGGVFLVGTLIQRVVSEDLTERFEMRVNDCKASDSTIVERSSRPLENEKKGSKSQDAQQAGAGDSMKGHAFTCDVRLPMVLKEDRSVSFPFGLYKASVAIELSSRIVKEENNEPKVYRPTIMIPKEDKYVSGFVCLKSPDEEAFDKSRPYDTVYPAPIIRVPPGKIEGINPRLELEWTLSTAFFTPLVTTILPAIVLVCLQWINRLYIGGTDSDDGSTFSSYFTNAITIVLALVVVIPQVRSAVRGTRNTPYLIDAMVFFLFLGTMLSAWPHYKSSMGGLIITSISLLFPLYGAFIYVLRIRQIRNSGYSIENLIADQSYTKGNHLQMDRLSKYKDSEYNICLSTDLPDAFIHGWKRIKVQDIENTSIMDECARVFFSKGCAFPVYIAKEKDVSDGKDPAGDVVGRRLVIASDSGWDRYVHVGHIYSDFTKRCSGSSLRIRSAAENMVNKVEALTQEKWKNSVVLCCNGDTKEEKHELMQINDRDLVERMKWNTPAGFWFSWLRQGQVKYATLIYKPQLTNRRFNMEKKDQHHEQPNLYTYIQFLEWHDDQEPLL
jgi:hypothetical protein